MKSLKIIYWVATGLICLLLVGSAANYVFNYAAVAATVVKLGYPPYILYPLALAKLLAVAAILTNRSAVLREWAYAGLFFNMLIALSAHLTSGVPGAPVVVLALGLLLTSRALAGRVRPASAAPTGQLAPAF